MFNAISKVSRFLKTDLNIVLNFSYISPPKKKTLKQSDSLSVLYVPDSNYKRDGHIPVSFKLVSY